MINPAIWYAERELTLIPPHFVKCPTPVNPESIDWVRNKTSGRYALGPADIENTLSTTLTDYNKYYVYFESTGDATIYELFWAGSN